MSNERNGSMGPNDFPTDMEKKPRGYSGRFGALLTAALVLTGLFTLAGAVSTVNGLAARAWTVCGVAGFCQRVLFVLCMASCFAASVRLALSEGRPFSRALSQCANVCGGLTVLASAVFPRLPGYVSSGYEFFSSGDFVLLDLTYLMVGVILLVFGGLLREGCRLQSELDEVL